MSKRGRLGLPSEEVSVSSRPRFDVVDRELDVAMALGNTYGSPRMPWETNAFLRNVPGPPQVPWLNPPSSQRSMTYTPPVQPLSSTQKTRPEKKSAIRHTVHKCVSQAADAGRSCASEAGRTVLLACADDEHRVWAV